MILGLTAATINPRFLHHVAQHGLNFGTTEEYNFRQNLFEMKDSEYAAINADTTNTFTVGHNHMSTWTHEEYKALLGYRSPSENDDIVYAQQTLDTINIPSAVDWRTKGAVNPVKNQGQCGSCWAFSATCSIEGHYQIASGNLISLAEQELVDCDTKCYGCNGGLQYYAMRYVHTYGQVLESAYTYTARDGTCQQRQYQAQVKVGSITQVPQLSADALKAAIAQGPTSVTVEADRSAFQGYTSGVLNSSECGTNLDHAITGVGYGSEGGQDYYIVRNSWGSNWGEQGYIRIATQSGRSKGICGIQQESVWATVSAA